MLLTFLCFFTWFCKSVFDHMLAAFYALCSISNMAGAGRWEWFEVDGDFQNPLYGWTYVQGCWSYGVVLCWHLEPQRSMDPSWLWVCSLWRYRHLRIRGDGRRWEAGWVVDRVREEDADSNLAPWMEHWFMETHDIIEILDDIVEII